MAAVLTGTPVAVAWGANANPAGQSITIPADCTAVYMMWAYDGVDANGHGLLSATLAGNAPGQTYEIATGAGYLPATGVAAWYNPSTGSQTLDVEWDTAPPEGPTCIVAFVKGGNTSAWRDADAGQGTSSTAVSVTLTTVAGDLVIKFDQRYDTGPNAPALSAGWTNGQTQTGQQSENARLSYISAAGTTQVCASENEEYSTIVAISIPESSGTAYSLTAAGGSFTLTGAAATLTYSGANRTVAANVGAFTLTGASANLLAGRKLTAEAGAFTLTGADALRDLSMVAAGGAFTLSGADATLSRGYSLSGAAGSFVVTGADAALQLARKLAADSGSFALTGADATLTHGASGAYTLTAAAGTFTLTGADATLSAARVLTAGGGSFANTGASATLVAARLLSAEQGAFALTGADAALTYDTANHVLPAESGVFALTGGEATLTYTSTATSGGWGLLSILPERRSKRKKDEPETLEVKTVEAATTPRQRKTIRLSDLTGRVHLPRSDGSVVAQLAAKKRRQRQEEEMLLLM